MRVIVIQPQMSFYGGAERVIVRLLNYMSEQGIPNTLLTLNLDKEIKRDICDSEISVLSHSVFSRPDFPYSLSIFPVVAMFGRYLRKNIHRFDVVNVHNFPAELTAPFSSKKVVWMCNEPPVLNFMGPSILEKAVWKSLENIDRFIVRNYIEHVCVADEFNAKRFEKLYGIRPLVIPYGIDCEIFEKYSKSSNKKEFTIVQVGMLTPFKNQLKTIESAAELRQHISNLKLFFAGTGESQYIRLLKRRVRELKLEKNVQFLGHISRKEVGNLYVESDVAVFPVKEQGGWLSPFEALCAEVPIVVSTQMTASKLIKNNKLGIVSDDLVGSILKIYNNQHAYRNMAKRAHRWIKKNLTWKKFCEKMVECFEDS